MKSIAKFLLLIVILISCQEDEDKVKEKEKGKIQFSFTVKGSTGLADSEPNSINVTVKDAQGAVVYNDVLAITKVGDDYLSEELSLDEGSYSITAFDVLDENNETIYTAPLEGSDGASLVIEPLNVEATVSPGAKTQLTIEVLAKGEIQFSFAVKGSAGLVDSEPNSIKITVKDAQEAVVFNGAVALTKVGDNYFSEEVTLNGGSYSITAFQVLNADNWVIYTAPLEGSESADLVIDPLDVETTVSLGTQTQLTIEVVALNNRALSFDGIDDYVNLGNIYDDIQLPVSISAWIWVDPEKTSQIPIFASQDNPAISQYKGFHFVINPTHLFTGYGDGLGSNNPYYRRELSGVTSGQFGKWIYVSAVIRGALDMDVYLDGVSLEKIYTGSSPNPMVSTFPDAVAKIGIWTTNDVTYNFKGMIDELKVWNRALTSEEVNFEMTNRPTGTETGLVGYWNFDEGDGDQVLDGSGENHNGVLQAGTARVAAPFSEF